MSNNFKDDLQNELSSYVLIRNIRNEIDISLNTSSHIEFSKNIDLERETDGIDNEIDEIIFATNHN